MKTAITYSRSIPNGRHATPTRPLGETIWHDSIATTLGAEIVERFSDDNIDNNNPDRPGWEAAIRLCEQRRVDYLIIYWRMTIHCTGVPFQGVVDRLAQAGTELVECTYSPDPDELAEYTQRHRPRRRR